MLNADAVFIQIVVVFVAKHDGPTRIMPLSRRFTDGLAPPPLWQMRPLRWPSARAEYLLTTFANDTGSAAHEPTVTVAVRNLRTYRLNHWRFRGFARPRPLRRTHAGTLERFCRPTERRLAFDHVCSPCISRRLDAGNS